MMPSLSKALSGCLFTAICFSSVSGVSIPADSTAQLTINQSIIPGAYIVELTGSQDAQEFLNQVETDIGNVTQRMELNFSLFQGVSFTLLDSSSSNNSDANAQKILNFPQVRQLWPVRRVALPAAETAWTAGGVDVKTLMRKRADSADDVYSPHVMTQVDQLHASGFTGNGTRIGILDTGVDYTHPALGGCFGAGCLVSYGADLVGDAWDGSTTNPDPVPDDDPFEDCIGHGTHVSGIIAAQENALGFIGAAPDVTLGMYRVFSCAEYSSTDVMLAAANQAYEDGSHIITASLGTFSGWEEDVFAVAVSRIVEAGVPCTFAIGNRVTLASGVFAPNSASTGNGVFSIASFQNTETVSYDGVSTVTSLPNTESGGFISSYSAYGPTYELKLEPTFGAPGGGILSTYPVSMGSYAVLSGTSMATPLAASVVALVAEARGGQAALSDTALLQRLLASTAKPVTFSETQGGYSTAEDLMGPAIRQGSGMIQALDAVLASTLLSESSLSFNDSEHFSAIHKFTVTNIGSDTIAYNLTHRPSVTAYALWPDTIYQYSDPVLDEGHAELAFEPSSFTLIPGTKLEVTVEATQPVGLDSGSLPTYSGYILISADSASNETQVLSLPYLGVAGSMRAATVLASDRLFTSRSDDYNRAELPANVTFQVPAPVGQVGVPSTTNTTDADTGFEILPVGVLPVQELWLVMGSALTRLEVVPVVAGNESLPAGAVENDIGVVTMGNIPGYPIPYHYPIGWESTWDGALASGEYAPPGYYKLVIWSLKIFGDRVNVDDYDTFESVPFWLRYVDDTTA